MSGRKEELDSEMSPPPRKRVRDEEAAETTTALQTPSAVLANISKLLIKDRPVRPRPSWITSTFWSEWDRGSKKIL